MSIYVNRTLNMKYIAAIGFDMDYTIVRYNTKNFEEMVYKEMVRKLIHEKKYPAVLENFKFEHARSIRGLVVDRKNGNIIKLSRYGRVKTSYHGTHELDFKNSQKYYKGLSVDVGDSNYSVVDTNFSVAYTSLFSQIVDFKDNNPEFNFPAYDIIESDLMDAQDMSHRDGTLKNEVRKNISHFIVQDPEIVLTLERFKKYNKKLWVITNSDYAYSKLLLDHTINPFLKNHKHWSELFEVVITGSSKPAFFLENRAFLRVDPDTGTMTNHIGPVTHGIYQGGSAAHLQKSYSLLGDQILYLGDHIYGDILTLKKSIGWRTALVIEEIEEEVLGLKKGKIHSDEINTLMKEKSIVEKQLDELYAKEHEFNEKVEKIQIQGMFDRVEKLDQKLSEKIKAFNASFNPYWGEVMRAGNEESYLAGQLERYACIYMSKISDFNEYSPRTYFRPEKSLMPHESI
ncbi:MAG: HAD-IG family 5'-nucleotidase [Bacteriovoracaceae bacterium]